MHTAPGGTGYESQAGRMQESHKTPGSPAKPNRPETLMYPGLLSLTCASNLLANPVSAFLSSCHLSHRSLSPRTPQQLPHWPPSSQRRSHSNSVPVTCLLHSAFQGLCLTACASLILLPTPLPLSLLQPLPLSRLSLKRPGIPSDLQAFAQRFPECSFLGYLQTT